VLLNVQAGVYVVAGALVLVPKTGRIRRIQDVPETAVVTVEGCRTSSPPATST
jgi:hypothetical protein